MSIWGFLGLGVVVFCLLIWMFLFGLWAGQTILIPGSSFQNASHLPEFVRTWFTKSTNSLMMARPGGETMTEGMTSTDDQGSVGTSFFSLQVAAVQERAEAERLVARWSGQTSQKAFYVEPEKGKETQFRVFIGRFDDLTSAKAMAEQLNEKNGAQAYVVLLPASAFPRT